MSSPQAAPILDTPHFVAPVGSPRRWLAVIALTALLLVGGGLRLFDLGGRSITHVEMYVPGIHLPEGLSQPRQRLTLVNVITGTFSSDTHPPGYYVLMWAWTKCFGAGIWSIRLPAALLGIACIPLLLWLGILIKQPAVGWLSAALLAVNGHHVFWSRVARMFSLACFLGLLATILLILLTRTAQPTRFLKAAYVLVLLLGLASHVFFWLVLGTHGLWSIVNGWSRTQRMPGVLKLQILTFILASPLLAFAAYQSGTPVAALSSNIGVYVGEFIQFAFLFPLQSFSTGVFLPSAPYPPIADYHLSIARVAFLVLSTVLVLVGITSMGRTAKENLLDADGPSTKAWIAAAVLAVFIILGFVFTAHAVLRSSAYGTLRITQAMSVLPVLLAGVAILLQRYWGKIWGGFHPTCARGAQGLALMMAVVPVTVLVATAHFKPILNARGMTFLDPYLLLVLAAGIVRLARTRWIAVAFILLLTVVHVESLWSYHQTTADPVDYRSFAAKLSAEYQRNDMVFVSPDWTVTPFFYYLHPDRYRFVGSDYGRACQQNPASRVWVIVPRNLPVSDEMKAALQDYVVVGSLQVTHAEALLYSPPGVHR